MNLSKGAKIHVVAGTGEVINGVVHAIRDDGDIVMLSRLGNLHTVDRRGVRPGHNPEGNRFGTQGD